MFNIGIGFALNGESEFRKAIKDVNNELKVLNSEGKLIKETYAGQQNSLEALTKKNENLEKQLDANRQKLELNRRQLEAWKEIHDKSASAIRDVNERIGEESRKLEEMKSSANSSTKEIEDQEKVIKDLNAELQNMQNAYDQSGNKVVAYQTNVNNITADIQRLDREIQTNNGYMDEARKSTDGCATSIDEYGKTVKDAEGKSKSFGETANSALNDIATTLQSLGIAAGIKEIGDAIMDCIDKAKEFETAVAKFTTIAGDSDIEGLRQQALSVSNEMGVSADLIIDAAYNAISAGVDAEYSVQVAAQATELAIAGFSQTDATLAILTSTMNAYKMSVDDVAQISDSLVTTQNLGVLTIEQLSQSMGKGIAAASAYGVDLFNLEAGYISLTKNGINVAESTTYLSGMFKELGDDGSKVSSIIMDKTGYSFGQLMTQGYSLGDVLKILNDYADGDSEALMNLWGSAVAGKAANAIVSQGLEEFNENLAAVRDTTGTTNEAFEKMADTTEFAEKKLHTAAENLKIAYGTQLAGAMKGLYDTGADILNVLTDFINKNPELTKVITAIVVAVGLATAGVIAWTVAQTALNAVMAANPFGLVAIGIGALVGAIAGVVSAFGDYEDDSESFLAIEGEKCEAIHKEVEELQNAKNARAENREEHETEIGVTKNLTAQLVELQRKEALSNEEQNRMKILVEQLNQEVPELNLELDEQGKIIGYTADELERYCEQAMLAYEIKFKEEDAVKIARDHYEAEKQLAEVQQNRLEIEKKLAEAEEAYNLYGNYDRRKSAFTEEQYRNAWMRDNFGIDEFDASALNIYYAQKEEEIKTLLNDLEGEYIQLTGEINANTQQLEAANSAYDEHGDVLVNFQGKHYLVTQNVVEQMQELQEQYEEAAVTLDQSIAKQVGLFEELSLKSDLTLEGMIKNLKSQTEVYTQYAEDLAFATEFMKTSTDADINEILQTLIDMGKEGAPYFHTFVQAIEEDNKKVNDLVAEYAEMKEARQTLAETWRDINDTTKEETQRLLDTVSENNQKLTEALILQQESSRENIGFTMVQLGDDIDTTFKSLPGIVHDKIPEMEAEVTNFNQAIIDSTNQVLEINEKSAGALKPVGSAIVEGIVDGITEAQDDIQTAMQGVIDHSAKAISFSAFTERVTANINETLGKAME